MDNIKIFESSEFGAVRTLVIDGETWYVGKDVADVLGLANHRSTLFKLVKPENKRRIIIGEHQNGDKHSCLVNADGVRSIAIRSKKAPTEAVKWLIEEVIPMATVNETEIQRTEAVDVADANVTIFENSEFGTIRAVEIDGESWFVGKDIAEILGYTNSRKALIDHVDEEDKGVTKRYTLGGGQNLMVINESGLYSLILSSKLPKAKAFKRWVTSEVLPSIRKHGVYAVDEMLNNPDAMIKALTALKEERNKTAALSQQIEQDKPKVLFADSVSAAKTSILIGDLAKLITQNGYKIGQKRLFAWLREHGYLIKSGTSKNMPTQRASEMGLFEVKVSTISNPDGSIRETKTTKVTGKGQIYFVNKFIGKGGEEDAE